MYVNLGFNENIYRLKNGTTPYLPLLVPNLNYKVDVEIDNIEPSGAADVIKVFVFNKDSTVPLITANIQMPLSEINMEQF